MVDDCGENYTKHSFVSTFFFLTIVPLQAFVQVRRASYARLTAAIHIVRRSQDVRSAAAVPQPSDEETTEFNSLRYGKRQKGQGNKISARRHCMHKNNGTPNAS